MTSTGNVASSGVHHEPLPVNPAPVLGMFRVHPNIQLPKFHTDQAACFDLAYNNAGKHHYEGFNSVNKPIKREFTNDSLVIMPQERIMVPTGIILDIPADYSVRIHPRSGCSIKQGLIVANCEGVIDSDYVDEIRLLMVNTSAVQIVLRNGDRIAQAEMIKLLKYEIVETSIQPVQKTNRTGGMGSTGI